MTSKEIFTKIIETQLATNEIISGKDWKKADWKRYLWLECAEVMDHLPWKNLWWNKQNNSEAMLKIEIIDVFIFGLSLELSYSDNFKVEDLIFELQPTDVEVARHGGMESCVEQIAYTALGDHIFNILAFMVICRQLNLDINELYRYYLGKHTLVQMRHDYMPDYSKQWGTACTDNSYLASVLNCNMEFQEVDETFEQRLYNQLESGYLFLKDL